MNILILTNALTENDGVTTHLANLLEGFAEKYPAIKFIILTGENQLNNKLFAGAEIITAPRIRHGNRSIVSLIETVVLIKRLVKSRRIDLIHAHNHYHAYAAFICSKLCRVSVIQTNHGILEPIGRLPHFSADHYIGVNPHIIEYMKSAENIPDSKISLVRLGIPAMNKPVFILPEKINFISAGRLIKEKGFDVLISAVSRLPLDILSRCSFTIAGKGEDEEYFRQLAAESGAQIHFAGNIPKLREHLNEYDVLINPTRSKSEGFPMIIIEAAFSGLGIITSKFNGLEFDFDGNNDGFIFEQDNSEELSSVIERIIAEPEECLRRRRVYYAKAGSLYGRNRMIDEMFVVYTGLAKEYNLK